MSQYVLSTATCTQHFPEYAPNAGHSGINTAIRVVSIKGGANSASSVSGFGDLTHTAEGQPLWTPRGVVTEITDEEAEFLLKCPQFIVGQKAGFYQIMSKGASNHNTVKKLAQDMTARDRSAPLTVETLKSQVKVTTKLEAGE
jgi:hypothetical protein